MLKYFDFKGEENEIDGAIIDALIDYHEDDYSADLPTSSVREGAELIQEQPIYPTQDSLSNVLLERIILGFTKHHGIDIATKFRSLDFQIFTPNR